jgi:hypothetical protein
MNATIITVNVIAHFCVVEIGDGSGSDAVVTVR